MTALDFIAAGVTFVTCGGRISVKGPPDQNLRAQLRHEVSMRDVDRRICDDRVGRCQSCGDPMRRGGNCELCICAGQKRRDDAEA